MQHAYLVGPQADAGVEQELVLGLASELYDPLVDVGAGQQHVDFHAPAGGGGEGPARGFVRHEVGGGDAHPLLGQGQQGPHQGGHVAPTGLGRAPHHLGHRGSGDGLDREPVDALVEQGATGLGPVLHERCPQPVDGWTADSEVGIAPLVRAPGVAPPLIGDADAPGEGHVLVADEDLPVAAVIGIPEAGLVDRPEPLDLGPGGHHAVHQRPVHAERAEGVEDDPHPHAGGGPLGQELSHVATDRALPVDEGQEVDGGGGRPDGLEHGREDAVAVAQHVDLVALGGRHTQQPFERPPVADRSDHIARHPLQA